MTRQSLTPVSVPDDAYNATTWNGSSEVPTKNAIRDKVETMGNVTGPATSTDESIARFDGTTGKVIQDGASATLSDAGGIVATSLGLGATPSNQNMIISRTATNVSGAEVGEQILLTASPASAPAAGTSYRGLFIQSVIPSSNSQNMNNAILYGGLGQVSTAGTGTAISSAFGMSFSVTNTSTGGITNAIGFSALVNNAGAGTIANAYGLQVSAPLNSGGGAVTTATGVDVLDQTVGGTNYSIRTRAGLFVVNENGHADADLRVEGDTDPNLLFTDASVDMVGIGTNAPTAKLDINSDTIRLRTAKTPASATAAGNAGDIVWDSGFIYICTATNTWKRAAIATW